MRLIRVASIVFAVALTFVMSGFGPAATAQQPATQSGDDERTDRNGQAIFRFDTFGDDATRQYRTTPLRGLWQHAPYFHDGSASDLPAVVDHYNRQFRLNLTPRQKADLVEFLKSL